MHKKITALLCLLCFLQPLQIRATGFEDLVCTTAITDFSTNYIGDKSIVIQSPYARINNYFTASDIYTSSIVNSEAMAYSIKFDNASQLAESYKTAGFESLPIKAVSNFYNPNAWVSQFETGEMKEVNCVPTSINTLTNLYYPKGPQTNRVYEIRKHNRDGGYSTEDVMLELTANKYIACNAKSENEARTLLDNGFIALYQCITSEFEKDTTNHIGIPRGSGTKGDHCVLLTGYVCDSYGRFYYEIVDPSWRRVENCKYYITASQFNHFFGDCVTFVTRADEYNFREGDYLNRCVLLRQEQPTKEFPVKKAGTGDFLRQTYWNTKNIYYQIGNEWYTTEVT